MLQDADNPSAVDLCYETVKIDSKLKDTYNLIRPIRFPDYNAKTDTKTDAKHDAKHNAKLNDFPHNQLLHDIDNSNNHYLRMTFTPNALNAREYNYFAYKLDS